MQRSEIISAEDIPALLEAVFSEEVTVYETYSEYDRQALIFENREAAQAHIDNRLSDYSGTIQLSLHYPSMVGTIDINRITIKPGSSGIRHIRYNIRGWGLIAFHIKITKRKEIECWIS